ncbi:MAG: hypothetical protein EBQ96_07545 [Proteobacteria bacterium]|nr:hypothetical protein [Pseudomonadota bacterium]
MNNRADLDNILDTSIEEKMKSFETHPYAEIFPFMADAELQELANDIKKTGQRETIKVLDGKILDGRNRYKACLIAKVEPRFEDIKVNNPFEYVVSLNLHRRHLKENQRAWIAANICAMQICTQHDASKAMNVSKRSVASASSVLSKGTPELQAAVCQGNIPISVAESIANLDAERQRSILALDKREWKKSFKNESTKNCDETSSDSEVVVVFSKNEIGLMLNAMRRLGEKDQSIFIRTLVVDFCKNSLPPTQAHFPNKPKIFHSDKAMILGKKGVSRQEEEEVRQYEMGSAHLWKIAV